MRLPRLCVVSLLACCATAARGAEPIDLRSLPTAVEAWSWQGPVDGLLVGAERIYAVSEGRLVALDRESGELAWATPLVEEGEDCACGGAAFVELEGRVFVPVGEAVLVLEADGGAPLARVEIGAQVAEITGPPVVVHGGGESGSVLVRLDEQTGHELARVELDSVFALERFGTTFVAHTMTFEVEAAGAAGEEAEEELADEAPPRSRLTGFDQELVPSWEVELGPYASVSREGDAMLLTDYRLDGSFEQRTLDPSSGQVSAPRLDDEQVPDPEGWPFACQQKPSQRDPGDSLELVLSMVEEGGASESVDTRVRWPGKSGWRVELPGRPEECLRTDDRLVLRLERGSTRNLLALVDARRGRRERLLSLPAGISLAIDFFARARAARLTFLTDDGLLSIDPFAVGPSGEESQDLGAAVDEVLQRATGYPLQAVARELTELGPEALALAIDRLPEASPAAVAVVAMVAETARHRPAAAPLAAAIARLTAADGLLTQRANAEDPSERTEAAWIRNLAVRALASLAGPEEVPVLVGFVDRGQPLACQAALAALGRIASPPALAVLERAVEASPLPAETAGWYVPPARPRLGPLTEAAARRLQRHGLDDEDGPTWEDMVTGRRSTQVVLDGVAHRVFPSSAYGGWADYWIVADGAGEQSFYLGELAGCTEVEAWVEPTAAPAVRATAAPGDLVVACAPPSAREQEWAAANDELLPAVPPLRLALGSWRRDSDRDGLSDRLEKRLALDPARADTDGDGVADARDRVPNAQRSSAAPAGDEALLAAAFATFQACADEASWREPWFVVASSPLAWTERPGPTFSFDRGVVAADGTTAGFLPLIELRAQDEPLEHWGWYGEVAPEPLEPGEHRVVVRQVVGSDEAPGAAVALVMRRLEGRWVVSRLESWWPWRGE
jgi:hypothetical protein